MFCPKCATQNVDGASFCRACGANISLVPHALTGQLPTANDQESSRHMLRKRRREPSLDEGIRSLLMGIGFIVVSIMIFRYSPGGWTWWYWMLIPASAMIGKGISQLVRTKQAKAALTGSGRPEVTYPPRPESLPVPRTGELIPPVPSVTEGTTRHLGAEAPTRNFDSLSSRDKPS